jgi:RNase P subunit RPR2
MDCYCDYEPAQFYRARRVKAAKKHKCYECARVILPGESYEYVSAMFEKKIWTFKTCGDCADIRQFVENSVHCLCWAHGSLEDDVRDTVTEAYFRAPDEVKGLATSIYRMVIKRNRKKAEARAA